MFGLFKKTPTKLSRLPLDLTIDSMLKISITKSLLFKSQFPDLQLNIPIGELIVNEYGQMVDDDFKIHRFYLSDETSKTDESYLLVMITDEKDNVVEGETRFYQLKQTIYPSSVEEWNEWIDSDTGTIGKETYTDIQVDYNYPLVYYRDSLYGTSERVEPASLEETVYPTVSLDSGKTYKNQWVDYNRWSALYDHLTRDDIKRDTDVKEIPDNALVEWCLLTSDGKQVDIYKGIDLDIPSIKLV